MSEIEIRAASALRRLGNAMMGHAAAAEDLARLTAVVEQWCATIESAPPRHRDEAAMVRDTSSGPPPDGEAIEHYDGCPVSGTANPLSFGLTARRDGDEVVCETVLGPACEGPPGRAHGGVVAALFDDATAFLTKLIAQPCYAAELTVRYRKGMPLGVPVAIRARITRREGRRIYTEAVAMYAGEVIAEATCLKVAVALTG